MSNDRALQYVTSLKAQKKRVHVLLGTFWQRYLHAIRVGDTTSYHGEMAAYWKTAGPRLFRTLGKLRVSVDVDGQMLTVPQNAKDCYTDKYYAYSCDLARKKALRNEKGTKNWVKKQMRALLRQALATSTPTGCATRRPVSPGRRASTRSGTSSTSARPCLAS